MRLCWRMASNPLAGGGIRTCITYAAGIGTHGGSGITTTSWIFLADSRGVEVTPMTRRYRASRLGIVTAPTASVSY